MNEKYNVFTKLHLEKNELFHSAMIATIVSHEKNSRLFFNYLKNSLLHDINKDIKDPSVFLKGIENLYGSIKWNSGYSWIGNEVNLKEEFEDNETRKIEKRKRGRADIWIGTNLGKGEKGTRYRLIIENKINAGNQDHQLRRYYRYLKDKRREFAGLFFLCPISNNHFKQQAIESAQRYKDKEGNDKESMVDGKGRPETEFAIITYKDDIIPWLVEVKKTASGDFLKVVSDYHELVVSLVKNWD